MPGKWLTALAMVIACAIGPDRVFGAEWDPSVFQAAETVDLRTVGAEEGAYWFPVWVVVVDDQVFVRLGSKAAERMRGNKTGTEVAVRVNEAQFDKVQTRDAPEYADRVNAAMAEKYWSDVFVRYFSHPMTLRLSVAPPDPAPAR
jgi:hypothetical protein